MEYQEMKLSEVEEIKSIDATWFIKNVWRNIDGNMQLVEINWTEQELPNGLPWHMDHFCQTIQNGGKAFGCFDDGILIGYVTINAETFGEQWKYVLLDQLFISQNYRCQGIGKELVAMCRAQALDWGADKIYICSASAEDTVAFYHKLGCVDAVEVNQELLANDPNDIQLELVLR